MKKHRLRASPSQSKILYSLPSGMDLLRWTIDQIYVGKQKRELDGFRANKNGGVTVSCKKHQGWGASWLKTKHLAGLDVLPDVGAPAAGGA